MSIFSYYFLLEFNWNKENGFSKKGFPRVKFYTNKDYKGNLGSIYNEILESVFTSQNMFKINFVEEKILQIVSIIEGKNTETKIYNESVGLHIKNKSARIIDMLEMYGSYETGEESRNWNIPTPIELQYIPTTEILTLFMDWRMFLEEQKTVILFRLFASNLALFG